MIFNPQKTILDSKYLRMTASDPAETKDKERTEATPVEEAQQGIDLLFEVLIDSYVSYLI